MNTNFLILGIAVILAVLVATATYTGGFFWLTPTASSTTTPALDTNVNPAFCVDPDGQNYFVRGMCSDNDGNYTDYCTGSNCTEYYCPTGTSKCTKSLMDCRSLPGSNGVCSDGACQIEQNQTNETNETKCVDSDGGLNYFVKGYCRDSTSVYKWDYCTDGQNGTNNTCNEYYCDQQQTCVVKSMDCKLLSGSTGVCHDGACQQYQQGEIRANSCDADDLCEMNSMFSSGGTTIGSEYNPGNSNLNVFGIATLAPKSMWNTRPFVRIRTIPTGGGMDKLQLLLADGNTASPTITMGYGAGTAKIETLGNIELNIDVSGAFLKIRTLDSSKTNLVDRLLITGRDQGHTYIKTPLTLNTNAGNGNAYACFAPDGTLFRSSVPCTQAPL